MTRDPDNDDPYAATVRPGQEQSGSVILAVLLSGLSSTLSAGTSWRRPSRWESERIARTADEILAANREGNEKPERSEAEEFLRDVLSAGPRPSTEIEAEAKGAGVSWRTVRRAQKTLGIKPYRKAESGDGLGKSGRWYWSLPSGGRLLRWPIFPMMATFQTWPP